MTDHGLVVPLLLAAAVLGGGEAAAQNPPSPFTGSISLGARSVDVSGTLDKYREDINLDDGPRLFDIELGYRPSQPGGPVDDFSLRASNLGGDPFENIHLGVRKYGAYDLRLDRRRSEYFHADTILPAALASVTGSTGGDFHHFDFERVRDTAKLRIHVTPATRIKLGLERQTRSGESTTTLDIQRDEFELDRPLDETLEVLRIGVEHDWKRVSLMFEETFSDFDNTSEVFLPGASPGQSATNPAELQFFFLDQAYNYDSRSHLLRVIARPTDRIDVKALWRREDLGLDSHASETSVGTTFMGTPFSTDLSGEGRAGRDIETGSLDASFRLGSRARLLAAVRSSRLDQQGIQLFGPDINVGDWRIDTDGVEVGAEIALAANALLSLGRSTESRDTDFGQTQNGTGILQRFDTDRDGYFVRLLFTTAAGLELTAAVEDNSIDDPFTLAAPTDSRRYKLTARYAWDNGVRINASHRQTEAENDASGWSADTGQTQLRVSYSSPRYNVAAGYTNIDVDRSINQLVTGGARQVAFPIAYDGDARIFDGTAQWTVNDRLAVGASLRAYDNRGSFRLERDDHRLFLRVRMTADYSLEASYRRIDYVEDAFDAYDGKLFEVALRLTW